MTEVWPGEVDWHADIDEQDQEGGIFRRLASPDRACTACGQTKPTSAFPSQCPPGQWPKPLFVCTRCAELERALQSRAVNYGIDATRCRAYYEDQDRRCAICREPFGLEHLVIDHCHETGRVRGLLCHHCNVGLGWFRDQATNLHRAANYIRNSTRVA